MKRKTAGVINTETQIGSGTRGERWVDPHQPINVKHFTSNNTVSLSTGSNGFPSYEQGRGDWSQSRLSSEPETANLDSQKPATLYLLAQIKDLANINEIYVEQKKNGQVKHWVVLDSRDYDVMDEIYEIEEDTLTRFPLSDLDFRITVDSEEGPIIRKHATRIFCKE